VVNFFLKGGEIKGQDFFAHNSLVEQILLLIAMVCIPWMLLVNPYLDWKADKDRKALREVAGGDFELSQMPHSYQV
jgi:V-type H+-transporting ATPase subunit a